MKSTYHYIKISALVFLFAIMAPSCKKFLIEDPKNLVAITNFYQTENDAISAVNAIYAYLNSISSGTFAGVYLNSFWVTAGLASDEMNNQEIFAPYNDQTATFTYGSQHAGLQDVWSTHYKTITIANIAIERIPLIQMDATLRTRLINEAKFLRGLMYFDMVRMFGSIPLILKEEEPLTPGIASVDDIYAQIISDLTAAEDLPLNYPAGAGRGRATSGAAKAILAKVYLTRGDYENCAAQCKEVINSGEYQLWDDFADVFKLSGRGGKEAVFSVGFGDAGGAIIFWEVGQFNVRLLPSALSAEGAENGQGWQLPTQNLYDSYESNDRRRAVTYVTEVHNPDGSVTSIKPYIQKYWDRVAEPTANGTANDYPVIRYADVLLMLAEADNELGNSAEAYTYINMVRKRARFDGSIYRDALPDYTNLSQADFRTAVLKERRWEFVAEGQRWFDLVRTNTLETLVPVAKPGVTPQAKHYLFPLPQRELDLNPNLVQNDGY